MTARRKTSLSARAFHTAWRVLPHVPTPILRGVGNAAALVVWAGHGGGVRQLEANLARVTGIDHPRALRRLSRAGMKSYFRYFTEVFQMRRLTAEQIAARVRTEGREGPQAHLASGKAVVLALGHLGNWDLAGLWAARYFARVTTVAERLEPPELFEEFVSFREDLGMRILAFGDDGVFRGLQQAARDDGGIIPLLADRDLGRGGVEVDIAGRRARVAAGPAALAISTSAPLFTLAVSYERLHGERARLAGSRWGIVMHFSEEIDTQGLSGPTRRRVQELTQRWVDVLVARIRIHPEDWHMLQKVFIEDLDPDKYAQITGDVR